MEQYPNEFIRGIANANELNSEGNASVSMFIFRNNPKRNDDKIEELSINWCDDKESSISIAMNQKKTDGSIQFKTGVAVLSIEVLDMVKKAPVFMKNLNYERAPEEDNAFHGNIICTAGLTKPIMDVIRSSLVLCVTSIILRETITNP